MTHTTVCGITEVMQVFAKRVAVTTTCCQLPVGVEATLYKGRNLKVALQNVLLFLCDFGGATVSLVDFEHLFELLVVFLCVII